MTPAVDLTSCDREPITRLGRIQDFGFLVALASDWTVVRASENLASFLGTSAADALGRPIEDLIDPLALHDIRNRVTVLRGDSGVERLYGVTLSPGQPLFDIAVHRADQLLVIEGERSGATDRMDAASLVRTMVARLEAKPALQAFHSDCARQVRAITGFRRVMIYRFSKDGAGEVIAESLNGPAGSFLGLHYPDSDIPVQARALYLRNPFRIIGNVDAETFGLLSSTSGSTSESVFAPERSLDLSLALTRAVSPIHIEYLRNMGVVASLSMSIVVEGELWGLIACHNDEAAVPSFAIRSACELFAQMYSMMLESRLRQAHAAQETAARHLADRMITAVKDEPTLLVDAGWLLQSMRDVIDCDGVAVFLQGRLATAGSLPPVAEFTPLIPRLDAMTGLDVIVTDRLSTLLPHAAGYATDAAGVLAIALSRTPRDWLLLFRRERLKDIHWAGDPATAKSVSADPGLSPRKSFEAFRQRVRGQCRPFGLADRQMGEIVRVSLVDLVSRGARVDDVAQRRLTERQETLIAELNHRVRNILTLIRGLITQTGKNAPDVASYVAALGGRVQALARAHDRVTLRDWGPGLLSSLFDDEIEAHVPGQPERFVVTGAAVHLFPQAFSTMALVIHELVTNSSKYGALGDRGRIDVDVRRIADGDIRIEWRETGGPVVRTPLRRGFGSAIIERTIPFELNGTAEVRYPSHGLEVDLVVPAKFVWTEALPSLATADHDAASRSDRALEVHPLAGMHVMLLEDNMIVALETEDLVRALGAKQVWAVASIAAADDLLARHAVDFAVLDVNVGDETSLALAARIDQRRIPFIFASGYGGNVDPNGRFASVPVVGKPYQSEQASRAIMQVLRAHRSAPGHASDRTAEGASSADHEADVLAPLT